MKPRLERAEERLDEPEHDEAELAHSLRQLADVNRWLGGARAVVLAVERLLPATGPVRILDVGCGAGDIDAALAARLRRRARSAAIVACDLHAQILARAQERLRAEDAVAFSRADARALPFADGTFDVAMMSLTLHHFDGEGPVHVLRELGRVAAYVVVNDLERNWQNYTGARLLARTVWSRNRLTRHDGPISVLRSFTASELSSLARAAGLTDVRVRRRFFYRLVMTARSTSDAARATVA